MIGFSRCFILLHDAGHNALFQAKWKNELIGRIAGFLIFIPFSVWQQIHNRHHGSIGNLDKRDINPEVLVLTIEEYEKASWIKKIGYRLFRSALVRFVVVPIFFYVLGRIPLPFLDKKVNLQILLNNVLIAIIIYVIIQYGFVLNVLVVYVLPLLLYSSFAFAIIYLQHQFEETYWGEKESYDYFDACFQGSSFLEFGKFFTWLTGNIGYHHIHHYNANIPFYNLPLAHEKVEDKVRITKVRFWSILQHIQCKVWDSENRKLVRIKSK